MNNTRKLSEFQINELRDLYDSGKSLRDCHRKFGYATGTIAKYVDVRIRANNQIVQRISAKEGSVKIWLKNTKQKLIEHRGGKCILCGYNKCIGALHFHHINPAEKSFTISGKTKAYQKLLSESEKCVILCANCHAEVHGGVSSI
jgi:5-methylcytosine-specific restriction endonuclease McrA